MCSVEEQYLFDLRGYLLKENAIASDELERMNERMDHWEAASKRALQTAQQREAWSNKAVDESSPAYFEMAPNRMMIRGILNTDDTFLSLVDHPVTLPYVSTFVEKPRLKTTWATFKWKGGGTGGHGNHTPFSTCNAYQFNQGIRCNLLICFFALKDIEPGAGALKVIPGSHKANFSIPKGMDRTGMLKEVPMRAGSVLIFSHDLWHESHNTTSNVRRTIIFTYCPSVIANSFGGERLYEGLFNNAAEGSWRKYLLRKPLGAGDSHPQPQTAPSLVPAG